MPSITYRIIFNGQTGDGFSEDQVKQNLQQIFKIDEERARGLLQPDTVIKSGLSLEHAEKYRDRLTKAGLLVAIHADTAAADTSDSEASDTDEAHTQVAPETVVAVSEQASAAPQPAPAPATPKTRRAAQVEFTGSGREYFGIWIVNILLTILTLGLYSAWATVRNNQYFYGNTKIDGSSFQYLADPWVIFRGRLLAVAVVIAWAIVSEIWVEAAIALSVGFIFLLPWIVTRSLKFNAVNSAFRNIRFDFQGTYWEAFLAILVWPLLGMLTLLLAMPLSVLKSQQFVINNSRFGASTFLLKAGAGQYYKFFLKVLGVAVGFAVVSVGAAHIVDPMLAIPFAVVGYLTVLGYLLAAFTNLVMNAVTLADHGFESRLGKRRTVWIYFTNSLLIGLTLGLYTPWAKVRMARYRASCTQMLIEGDLNQFVAAEHTRTSAIGQEIGDAFDVGFAPI